MTALPDSSSLRRLAAPPRPVPLLVRLRLLFGGMVSQLGWFFLGFGTIFFWAFVCRAELTSWYRFRGALPTAEGRVTASSDTGASEGGSKSRRGTPIYKNEFTFAVDDQEYKLTFAFETCDGLASTATARTNAPEKFQDEGEPLVYDPENPVRGVMLDNLPGAPHIGEDGHVFCQQPARALLSLLLPLATILGQGIYAAKLLVR